MSTNNNNCNENSSRPVAVDLFSGVGGFSLGIETAGFDVLAAVELDPINCVTYKFNFPNHFIFCRDIFTVTGQEIRANSSIGDKDIDLCFGSPPCQGFSLIGNRSLDDARNLLLLQFVRLVIELKAKYFLLENVRGLAIGDHKKLLSEAINLFKENGYEVEEDYQILNAAAYGVPQNRHRLFLFGCLKGLQLPCYPSRVNESPTVTVWDALGDLPEAQDYEEN